MDRRVFLGFPVGLALGGAAWLYLRREPSQPIARDEIPVDVAILGAGLGGCAAALAALKAGATVALTEPTTWLGGQLTSQAVPPDEHAWIEDPRCVSASYFQLREAIRTYYREQTPLLPNQKANKKLNPGNGWVSRLCCEPKIAERILSALLIPYVESGQLKLHFESQPVTAEVDGDRIRSVTVQRGNTQKTLIAKMFIDATEEGDLLPIVRCEHVTGSESKQQTQEPDAAETADPGNIQSITHCFALEYRPGENHGIDKPADYERWRTLHPELKPAYNGPLFSWNHPSQRGSYFFFDPASGQNRDDKKSLNLWSYRRIRDHRAFTAGSYPGDISIINWHHNDYFLGPIHACSDADRAKHLQEAKNLSQSLVYWLQHDCPRADGGLGWPGLRLCPEVIGSDDGYALAAYIRESRRIQAEFTVLQQHVSRPLREKAGHTKAEVFPDSIGIGHYPLDLHPTCRGENGKGWPTFPFQVPLGALIPVRLENLLAGCKNIGVTHLSNGCYRLHPVEWVIGEAAGLLAAQCAQSGQPPRATRQNTTRFAAFRNDLHKMGAVTEWPNS